MKIKNDIYPKVMIISVYDFYKGNDASSITLRNMFSSWPNDKLCHIHCGVYSDSNEKTNKDNVFYLYIKDIKFHNILLKFKRLKDKLFVSSTSITNESSVVIFKSTNIITKYKQKLKLVLSSYADLLPYKISNKCDNFIKAQKADIIYVIPSSKRIMTLVHEIHNKYSIPILPHFMDDWPSTIYTSSILSIIPKVQTLNYLKKILKISNECLVISSSMQEEYVKRYNGINFTPIMNTIPLNESNINNNIDSHGVIKSFCYVGGLHLKRWESLLIICSILVKRKNIEFIIYTKTNEWNNVRNKFEKYPFVKYGGYIKPENVMDIYQKHDCLIFVESFDENVIKYTRFSISTKIPEYLSLVKPIIAIGPSEVAAINYLKTTNTALIIDETNIGLCNNVLNMALNNPYYFYEKKINCKNTFIKNHLQSTQHTLLKNVISRVKFN